MMTNINNRFKDAPWYKDCVNESIFVIGCGGISSNALYYLTKTIPAHYIIMDDDIVEEFNVGTQFFNTEQIGKFKVEAMYDTIKINTGLVPLTLTNKYDRNTTCYKPIMISGLDNMEARKNVYNQWKKHDDREIYIEARLRANLYEIYVVLPGREKEYEKTLFDDSEVDEGPCTFKQTAYFGGLIGARITHVLVNYLTNKYTEPILPIPFAIKEVGDLFYFETIDYVDNKR